MWKWDSGDYAVRFMDKVVAWFRLHNLVEQHVQDAVNQETKRKSKR
jgi:hypothetical protein